MMKRNYWFLFILLLFSQPLLAERLARCQEILDYIHEYLPDHGTLLENANGFLYVKVDDDYIHKLNEFVKEEGFEEPPYFGQLYTDGAHVSVIYPEELADRKRPKIAEVGKKVYFQTKGCGVWETPGSPLGSKEVCFVLVDAPFLGQLREKYGFSAEDNFHITIGIRR